MRERHLIQYRSCLLFVRSSGTINFTGIKTTATASFGRYSNFPVSACESRPGFSGMTNAGCAQQGTGERCCAAGLKLCDFAHKSP